MRKFQTIYCLPFCAVVASALLVSCAEKVDSPEDVLAWLGEPEHGLVRQRRGKQVQWKAKYLPSDYLAWRYLLSLDEYDQVTRDSTLKSYENTIGFLLTVMSGREGEQDIMMNDIASFDDFQARAMQLNFDVKEMVEIRYGGVSTPAVISTMENTYGLSEGRDIMVIFAKSEEHWQAADTVDLILDDRIFNSGIQHFTFARQSIAGIPAFNIPATRTNKH